MRFINEFGSLPQQITRRTEIPYQEKEHLDPASSPKIYQLSNNPDDMGYWLGGDNQLDEEEIKNLIRDNEERAKQ